MEKPINASDKRSVGLLRQKSNVKNSSYRLLAGIFLLSYISLTEGYCYSVIVRNAIEYHGQDDLSGDDYKALSPLCEGLNVWGDDYDDDNGRYERYISYRRNIQNIPGNDDTRSGWVIRSFGCNDTSAIIWAVSPSPRNYKYYYPYDVPRGSWYQRDASGDYLLNPDLYVECYNPALSAWTITVIVIGCLSGLLLIVGIIVVICSKQKKNKQRTAPRPPPYVTSNVYVTTVGMGGTPPYTLNATYSSPISPPAYDNSPPPAYLYNADTHKDNISG